MITPDPALTLLVRDLQLTVNALTLRATRIETRLAKLMLHLGMKNDGRKQFISEQHHEH